MTRDIDGCRSVLALIAAVALAGQADDARAQPSNDDCASAIVIASVPASVAGSNIGATGTDLSSCITSDPDDVWYSFTPAVAGRYVFDTAGSPFDTGLAIFDGEAGCPGVQLGCDDDGGPGTTSRILLELPAGLRVLIRVSGFRNREGNFTLNVATAPPPPPNDECVGAPPSTTFPVSGENINASTSLSLDQPGLCGGPNASGGANDVFYAFTPASSGVSDLHLCGSNFDAVLSVHSGCPATAANLIACVDASDGLCGGGTQPFLRRLPLTGNTTYVLRVAGARSAAGAEARGQFVLVAEPSRPRGSGEFTPFSVRQGQPVRLVVTVEPGSDPGAITSVTADLTDLGGSAATALRDDGLGGDSLANDGQFTVLVNVGLDAVTTYRVFDFVITDVQGRLVQGSADLIVRPVNDECVDATRIDAFPFAASVFTAWADPDDPTQSSSCDAATQTDYGVWYRIDVGAAGVLTGTINAPDFNDMAALWSGTDCFALTPVRCVRGPEDPITLNWSLQAGTTYFLQLGDEDGGGGGDVAIALNFTGTLAAAPGACCSGSICSVVPQSACGGSGVRFAGSGTVCNPPGNLRAPCCKADFNQSGSITVQDVFDFLGAWFASDPRADIDGFGPTVQDVFDFLSAWFGGC